MFRNKISKIYVPKHNKDKPYRNACGSKWEMPPTKNGLSKIKVQAAVTVAIRSI